MLWAKNFGWAACFLALSGCGGQNVPAPAATSGNTLRGSVTLDDELVKAGIVRLVDQETGVQFEGRIGPKGKYTVDKLPTGKLRMAILPLSIAGNSGPGSGMAKAIPPEKKQDSAPENNANMPAKWLARVKTLDGMPSKYSSMETSGLEVTISAGENQFDVKLRTKP